MQKTGKEICRTATRQLQWITVAVLSSIGFAHTAAMKHSRAESTYAGHLSYSDLLQQPKGGVMSQERSIRNTLIDAEDCCIVVVDVQSVFLDKLTEEDRRGLVPRIVWFANVATRLGIPSVVTAEDIEKNGSISPELAAVLPASTTVHNKMVFGLAADPKIYDAIESTGKRVAVLVGLETDVCVAQSAIGT